jgi:nucleoside-diphosphate-sugar epimerase
MKVLVTGATGFIGRALINLFDTDTLVVALRNRVGALPEAINQIEVGELSKSTIWTLAFKDIDTVIHVAGRAHVANDRGIDPISEFRRVNTDATLALAQNAANKGVRRFIFVSSIGVNGNNNSQAFTESDRVNPQEYYAISKYEAEEGLLKLAEETGMEVVIVRPPLVYGPNAPGNFGSLVNWVNKEVPLPFGSIHNQRSLVALDNLVDFIALCADREKSPKAANQVFLISDCEDVSTTQLLQKVAKAFNKKAFLLPIPVWLMTFVAKILGKGDVANRLFGSLQVDSSKARDLLGWKPITTMDEQLQKTAQAYLSEKHQ